MKFQSAPSSGPSIGLLVLALLAASAPWVAHAQDHSASIAILGLSSKDGEDEAAAQLTDALRGEAADDSELALSDTNASLSQLVILHDCEITDATCRDGIARELEVGELIYGGVRRADLGGHEVELHH